MARPIQYVSSRSLLAGTPRTRADRAVVVGVGAKASAYQDEMKRRFNLLRSANQFRSSITGKTEPQIAGGNHPRYSAEFCEFMNKIDPRVPCKFGCEWISPYGWVPNATCPGHD